MTEQSETFLQKQLRYKREREAAARPAPTAPVTTYTGPRDDLWQRRAAGWCHSALQHVATDIAAMDEDSGRNSEYSRQLWRFLRYAHAGHLNTHHVLTTLRDAATRSGLQPDEIDGTERSAIRQAQQDGPSDPELPDDTPTPPADPFTNAAPAEQPPDTPEETVGEKIRRLLPELDWNALWADENTEEWIIEPLLPARRLVAIYSPPKMGKSLLSLEMAVAIAKGCAVLGVNIDRPRHVLYIDFENDPKADIRERLQAMGAKPADLTNLHYLSFPTLAALDGERGALELMAAVTEYACEVVIIDTVSRAVSGDENENDTWLNFYRQTGLRLKQAGVSMLRLDHSGKDESKGQRGGSAKGGDVDAVWKLSRVRDETYQLTCELARMPITEKILVVHRELTPLRHRVDAEGRKAAWRVKVEACIRILDELHVPDEASNTEARAALKAAGEKASNEPLTEAVRRRRRRIQPVDNHSEDQSERHDRSGPNWRPAP